MVGELLRGPQDPRFWFSVRKLLGGCPARVETVPRRGVAKRCLEVYDHLDGALWLQTRSGITYIRVHLPAEVSDAAERGLQKDEPERRDGSAQCFQGRHGRPGKIHYPSPAGVYPRLRRKEFPRKSAEARPQIVSPEDLKGEYERLLYLWAEELYSEHPDWDKLDQWNEELKG